MEKKDKINRVTKVLLLLCGIGLLFVLFTPIWKIDLVAPQYPEGLALSIYADKLAGDVDIINGLNHYIGMRTLHTDDFVEFKVLPGLIMFFAAFFIVTAIFGRKWLMNILFMAFVVFGITAMADFWRWEYDYGHNLNPNAPIIVPGMAYQPPLIGFKQLLNFGAYSIPDIGGWIFICAGIILLFLVVYEWRDRKKLTGKAGMLLLPMLSFPALLLSACSTDPEPFRLGKDSCGFCKMTISDNRFGAEIVTKKSKIYKFDDTRCLVAFLNLKTLPPNEIAGIYFIDFSEPHQLVSVNDAHFLQSPGLKSPMNGNIAVFRTKDSLTKALPKFYGNIVTWEDIQK